MFIEFWAGQTVKASMKETVVYWSIEKVLFNFVGATRNVSALSTALMDRVIPWI